MVDDDDGACLYNELTGSGELKTIKILLLWNHNADDLESCYAALGTQVLPSLFK